MSAENLVLAVKCAPEEKLFSYAARAGIPAVELYLCGETLKRADEVAALCKDFDFRYSMHAPNDAYEPKKLSFLAGAVSAEVVVAHNIFWEDEWKEMISCFKGIPAKLCVENIATAHEPLKFMRRYGLGCCLDLEHLQLECAGVYEDEFLRLMKIASYIHMTGYKYPSEFWHTHIHHLPQHNVYLLDLLLKAGYSGFLVSEAKVEMQSYDEFSKLHAFFESWKAKHKEG